MSTLISKNSLQFWLPRWTYLELRRPSQASTDLLESHAPDRLGGAHLSIPRPKARGWGFKFSLSCFKTSTAKSRAHLCALRREQKIYGFLMDCRVIWAVLCSAPQISKVLWIKIQKCCGFPTSGENGQRNPRNRTKKNVLLEYAFLVCLHVGKSQSQRGAWLAQDIHSRGLCWPERTMVCHSAVQNLCWVWSM